MLVRGTCTTNDARHVVAVVPRRDRSRAFHYGAVKERRARKTDRQRERERQRETKRVRRETGERTERKQRNVEWKKKWKENGGSRAFSGIEFGAMDG